MTPNRNNPWKSYHVVATQTASPGHLILMLFDGALRFLEQAKLGFNESDPAIMNEAIHNNIQRAQAIINELNCSLNLQDGGELAQTLRRLYEYFDHRLFEANLHKEQTGINEVITRISTLRDAWAQMLLHQGSGQEQAGDKKALCALG